MPNETNAGKRTREVNRGFLAPLVEYGDGTIAFGVPNAALMAGQAMAGIPQAVYNTATQTVPDMLAPGYDYSNTQQAARDAFDVSGFISTGGIAGAPMRPANSLGIFGGRLRGNKQIAQEIAELRGKVSRASTRLMLGRSCLESENHQDLAFCLSRRVIWMN